jgi:membrane protease subunit HflK
MGWNEPDKGKDSWKGKEGPPDLDEAIARVCASIKKWFSKDSGKGSSPSSNSDNSGVAFLFGLILIICSVVYVLAGIFIVDPAEQAVILRFGKYQETVGPGPHWIPRIIESKEVMNVDRVMDYSYSAQMLTRDENLVSVSIAVQYRINELKDYLYNVANAEESLQQATSSALRQVVGTTTLDELITEGREVWATNVQETLTKTLELYKTGILIVNVSPQPARAPESVQEAFDDAIKAQEDEKRFKEQAYAYAAKVVPIAEGKASRIIQEAKAASQQVVLKAQGEVAEYLSLLPQYLSAPAVLSEQMYLSMMQKVLSNTSKIVIDGKSGNLLYLPLDKLSQASAGPVELRQNTKQSELGQAENDNVTAAAARDLTRPSYTQGRE